MGELLWLDMGEPGSLDMGMGELLPPDMGDPLGDGVHPNLVDMAKSIDQIVPLACLLIFLCSPHWKTFCWATIFPLLFDLNCLVSFLCKLIGQIVPLIILHSTVVDDIM